MYVNRRALPQSLVEPPTRTASAGIPVDGDTPDPSSGAYTPLFLYMEIASWVVGSLAIRVM
jgi:hypothetical protein